MADAVATSFATPNYSGLLFAKGRTDTPFSTIIGAKRRTTNNVEFAVGVEYNVGEGEVPNYSENDTLNAPDATVVTRGQKTNVTQIFMDSFSVGDVKESNMGTLSGINVAGQQPNPKSELDFQAGVTMQRIAQSVEKTLILGTFNKAENDSQVNKTRGMVAAIETNVADIGGKALSIWDVADMLVEIRNQGGSTEGLVLWCDSVTKFQISAEAAANNYNVYNSHHNVHGINITRIETPMGDVDICLGRYLPVGTAMLLNFGVIAPVEQPHPRKGNFYLEKMGKTGFKDKYSILGQVGLDHGPEWMHGKFTNIKATYDRPTGLLVNHVNA
ncbi:MAG: DUF5309 family protein [Clostridia bacterium]|nr:DUF5309 family protein [Clostridia bacterium]